MGPNEEAAREFNLKLEKELFYGRFDEDKQSYDEGPDLKQDIHTKKHRNPMSHLIPKKKKIIMKNTVAGHTYELSNFENKNEKGQILQFIHKEPKEEGSTELITISDGTTNEEVLEALIDRISFLQTKFPCKENACCITHLQEGLMWLEKRTSDRIKRNVEGKQIK